MAPCRASQSRDLNGLYFALSALAKNAAIEMGAGEDEALIDNEEHRYIVADTGTTTSAAVPGTVEVIFCGLQEDKDEKRHYLRACVVCGNRAARFPEPISSMHPGNDALAAVATFRSSSNHCLANITGSNPKPLAGRKLLAFSDNRQDAAFFAPFFERTSLELTLRRCIAQALQQR